MRSPFTICSWSIAFTALAASFCLAMTGSSLWEAARPLTISLAIALTLYVLGRWRGRSTVVVRRKNHPQHEEKRIANGFADWNRPF